MLGGGAAGATAAKLLAQWGHSVRLITRPAADSRLAVSLPPSCRKLFETIGVNEVVDEAGFVRASGNTVWWGESEPRVELFADGERGWQVGISRLDELLLSAAATAGATIECRVVTEADLVPAQGHRSFWPGCARQGRAGLQRSAAHGGPGGVVDTAWRVAGSGRHAHADRILRVGMGLVGADRAGHASYRRDGRSATFGPGS